MCLASAAKRFVQETFRIGVPMRKVLSLLLFDSLQLLNIIDRRFGAREFLRRARTNTVNRYLPYGQKRQGLIRWLNTSEDVAA